MLLSIAIPTYNRSTALRKTLDRILPQLAPSVECVVLDNSSTDATADVVRNAQAESRFVRVIRHPINIGGSANFLRCFELAHGRWLWILPDDDVPGEDAVQRILGVIEAHPDAAYINFATSLLHARKLERRETRTAKGLPAFIDLVDSFSHLLFLTAGLYRREPLLDGMPVAARMAHTYGPQLALLLCGLARSPTLKLVQSHLSIADWGGPAEWDKEHFASEIYHLLELIPAQNDRDRFCRLMEKEVPPFLARRNWISDVLASGAHENRDVLSRAIQRYSTIAALTGRFRTAAIVGNIVDACSPLGSRWVCRLIYSTRNKMRRSPIAATASETSTADIAAERKM